MATSITIEVAYATAQRQLILSCEVAPGTSLRDAVRASGIAAHFPEIDIEHCDLGIFGKIAPADHPLVRDPFYADVRLWLLAIAVVTVVAGLLLLVRQLRNRG